MRAVPWRIVELIGLDSRYAPESGGGVRAFARCRHHEFVPRLFERRYRPGHCDRSIRAGDHHPGFVAAAGFGAVALVSHLDANAFVWNKTGSRDLDGFPSFVPRAICRDYRLGTRRVRTDRADEQQQDCRPQQIGPWKDMTSAAAAGELAKGVPRRAVDRRRRCGTHCRGDG
jgi:hypothetical protein